ncbi:C40 family peptidase [Ferruginibacter sp. SUN106]|uniref:C40 family peptidase n=1 Tax=Ferruginibacter sp. SUN106 TaxID=2978348 RepID=UPI003D362F85
MKLVVICFFIVLASCTGSSQRNVFTNGSDTGKAVNKDTVPIADADSIKPVTPVIATSRDTVAVKRNGLQEQLLVYAGSLIGTPYKYASTDPEEGFDCSGFITHVFNHFNITVPRSSVDFTNYGKTVSAVEARPADLILFTGTDSSRIVGHMGIIVSNDTAEIKFIHSTSGKANGVTITPLNDYYKHRFVKVIRVFN